MVELGVSRLVGRNGHVVSTAAPQYQPSHARLQTMTRRKLRQSAEERDRGALAIYAPAII